MLSLPKERSMKMISFWSLAANFFRICRENPCDRLAMLVMTTMGLTRSVSVYAS